MEQFDLGNVDECTCSPSFFLLLEDIRILEFVSELLHMMLWFRIRKTGGCLSIGFA